MRVRDDPSNPDPGFAELYGRLPAPEDLEPWLSWCRRAAPPVLYLGIGAGRLAAPLHAAGIELVGVDAHPGMLELLHGRLPRIETHLSRIEEIRLGRRFDLVIAPSNLLHGQGLLRAAAAQVAPGGRLGLELMNPHWLRGRRPASVRLLRDLGEKVDLEIDHLLDGATWTQVVTEMPLVPPESIEAHLAGAGLRLLWMGGQPGLGLSASSTFYVLAGLPGRRSRRPAAPAR